MAHVAEIPVPAAGVPYSNTATKKEMSGGEAETTNNRMELMGVIAALSVLKEPCIVSLYTDSQYIANAINEGWLKSWIAHNWKRKTGPVKNADLWKEM